jgi:hypothetical protein
VGALDDIAPEFVEVKVHRLGIGVGQGERRADAAWTDRAEQVGVAIALARRLARPCPALGPLSDLAVFLVGAGLSWNQISIGVVSCTHSRWALSRAGDKGLTAAPAPPSGVIGSPRNGYGYCGHGRRSCQERV